MNKTFLQLLFACLFAAVATAQNVQVTFRVDLSKVSSPAIQGAHFAGTPNNWMPEAMNALGGGQFEITLAVAENSTIEYKFLDGPNNFEPDAELPNCGTPNANRSLTVGTTDLALPNVCFGKCAGCQTSVFVSVNMSDAGPIDPAGVFVSTASGDVAMTDGGNGIWSTVLVLPNFSTIKYRFKNGTANEPTADLSTCGVADGAGGFWRTATVLSQDLTAPTVCFGKCGGCPLPCPTDPDGLICENFNSLSLGQVGPQVVYFSGQNGVDGGPEDPLVSAAQSSDNGLSLRISGDNSGGAVSNSTVLRLGNQSSGKFDLAWKMFFPAGKTGFFNIDSDEAGFGPMVTVVTSPSGQIFLIGGNGEAIGNLFVPNDTWVNFRLLADVSNKMGQLRIGQNFTQNMAFNGTLGGLNFSGIAPNTEFFVDEIEFRQNALFVVNLDDCPSAFDLSPYLAGPSPNLSTPLFDNTGATAETGLAGVDCFTEDDFGGTDEVQNSLWYKFEGNGHVYQIQTAPCDAGAAYLDGGDTQMAAYTGADCANLIPLGCNDDLGVQFAGDFRSGLVIATEMNKSYRLLVDGFDGTEGKFCLQFTQFQQVTFQVDATNIASVDPQGLFIQGSWDGFSTPHAMTPDANNVWKYTTNIPPGAIIEWKYLNGPTGWEPDAALGACGVSNPFGGFNRVATVALDTILPKVCFGSCDTCEIIGWYDDCAFAEDITSYFGQGIGVVSNTPLYSNADATTSATDPVDGWDCFNEFDGPNLARTTYFKFLGDGKFYKISTGDCNSTDYIDDGDTQMAVYEGENCQFSASVACNDDLNASGDPDYRAGLTINTVAGQWYTIMIDGWGDAAGEFCFEIQEIMPIDCADAMLGQPETDVLNICFGQTQFILIDEENTVVPNVGPVAGFTYVVTLAPIPADWVGSPAYLPDYFGSTGLSNVPYSVPLENDGSQTFSFYFTPILLAGGTDIPDSLDQLFVTGGCFIYGTPILVNILPEFDPIDASGVVINETAPGNNGSITITVSGGSGNFFYLWSNGSSEQNQTGLAAGNYTVTIADATGCAQTERGFIVQNIIGTTNLAGLSALSILPNPTNGPLQFSIQLIESQPVSVRLVNTLGHIIAVQNFSENEKTDGSFDLSGQPSGVFFLRFEAGGKSVERKIVLIK